MKEISVTRTIKPLLKNKKRVRKITRYYDHESRKELYTIYLKRGCINCYDNREVDSTTYGCSGNINTDAQKIDGWLDEILYNEEALKQAITDGVKIEYLE